MSGRKRKYDYSRYEEALKTTVLQKATRRVKIDYAGLIKYAREKGVQPCDLEKEEQERFVVSS